MENLKSLFEIPLFSFSSLPIPLINASFKAVCDNTVRHNLAVG
ncbi:hypothetical protein T07_4260 [Trichinella nelsoni]|uniref:Uncharacterized protein n=1 Tax=Trichinella nelsoni TaxID=6336 RepID=A0A0V0SJF7_9BILA|nr:hypothetical protein T07_4260 [Trichinella nelsoni]